MTVTPNKTSRRLTVKFHGRIIDHLGIQMYESPIASVAELVANAWDAEAENVWIELPNQLLADSKVIVRDDGNGMTFEECDDHYLNVGYLRRGDDPAAKTVTKHRPILGRKGIGKFAGFGIADVIIVDTTSVVTGERTAFELRLGELRAGGYVSKDRPIETIEYVEPRDEQKANHGTALTLGDLKVARAPSVEVFRRGLARRFLLHQRAADFRIFVNGEMVPGNGHVEPIEYEFPRDYTEDDTLTGLISIDENGWGSETLIDGHTIRWRVQFFKHPIQEDELRGISVFANQKIAQMPFFFNLSGGLSGQHGQQYLSGQVEADFVDALPDDLITTERQRINWSRSETAALLEWGQQRTKDLLALWRDRRAAGKIAKINEKVAEFSQRLNQLPKHERKTVTSALTKLATVPSLEDDDFEQISDAVLTAWEGGRLKELIADIAERRNISSDDLIKLLAEQQVLEALHVAEIVSAKREAIVTLEKIVAERELENDIRDYIAQRPWLLDQRWMTFKRETGLNHIFAKAAADVGLSREEKAKRIDLALRSGDHLLVVEFMRPGVIVDWDHLQRSEHYVLAIRAIVRANTAIGIRHVSGLIVADKVEKTPHLQEKIEKLRQDDILAADWPTLLSLARAKWGELLDVLVQREPGDARLQRLKRNG